MAEHRRRRSPSRSRSPRGRYSSPSRSREYDHQRNYERDFNRSHTRRPSRSPSRSRSRPRSVVAPPSGKRREEPSFEPSGKLAAESMTRNGVLMKYAEPQESCAPPKKFRFHVFKGDSQIAVIALHPETHYLIGREHKICDIVLEHESISKQHAVLQYREVVRDATGFGQYETHRKPYLLDLDSANGTFLNGVRLEGGRYYEMKVEDLVKFGASTREYVFMVEDSK